MQELPLTSPMQPGNMCCLRTLLRCTDAGTDAGMDTRLPFLRRTVYFQKAGNAARLAATAEGVASEFPLLASRGGPPEAAATAAAAGAAAEAPGAGGTTGWQGLVRKPQ